MQEPPGAVACGVSMFNTTSSNAQQSYYAIYTKGKGNRFKQVYGNYTYN
jgi:hypothetical protein